MAGEEGTSPARTFRRRGRMVRQLALQTFESGFEPRRRLQVVRGRLYTKMGLRQPSTRSVVPAGSS